MLAKVAVADSARTVRKKYSIFIYSEAEPHAMYAVYINRCVHCVFYSILLSYKQFKFKPGFKQVCPKTHLQNFCLSRFSYSASSNTYTDYVHLVAYSAKKGNLHFNHVLKDSMLVKDMVTSPKK